MTPRNELSPVSDLDRDICKALGLQPIAWEDLEASRLEMVRRFREESGVIPENEDPDSCDYNCTSCDAPCSLED
jgi:hypothetical protein